MKLYLVTCKGMTYTSTGNCPHGIAFVVAEDSEKAYEKLRKYLDENELGFRHERELSKIELLADADKYPDVNRLFL